MRQRPIESVEVVLGNRAVKIVYTPAARVASCSGSMARRRQADTRFPLDWNDQRRFFASP